MKKIVSFVSLALAIAMALSTFIGCSLLEPDEKVFTKAGLSITLDESFTEQDIVTQTAYYVSLEVIVTTLTESDPSIDDYTVEQYAELVCNVNNLSNSEIVAKDGYAEFDYEKTVNGKDYYYYARCLKNGTDFWLIQFACETKNKAEHIPSFEKWAGSITFVEE